MPMSLAVQEKQRDGIDYDNPSLKAVEKTREQEGKKQTALTTTML